MARFKIKKQITRKIFYALVAIFLSTFLQNSVASAAWSLNLGFHNPPNSTFGVNFLYFGSQWGFEAGVGWVDARSTDNGKSDTTSVAATGDVNGKYFFTSGSVRPYLQGGIGVGIGAAAGDRGGVGAGASGLFAGAGLLFGSPKFYGYGSYNVTQGSGFGQAGIGFGL